MLRQCESTNRYNDPAAPAGAYGMLQGWALALTYWTKEMTRYFGYPSSPPYTATPVQQDILGVAALPAPRDRTVGVSVLICPTEVKK